MRHVMERLRFLRASKPWVAFLTGRAILGPLPFFLIGFGAALLKFAIDRFFDLMAGQPWRMEDMLGPRLLETYLFQNFPLNLENKSLVFAQGICAAIFAYIGVVTLLARLRSARLSPYWVLIFFVPVVKWIFFGLLCVLPNRPSSAEVETEDEWETFDPFLWTPQSPLGSAILAILTVATAGVALIFFGTEYLQGYGYSLFIGIPFFLGFISTLIYNLREPRTLGSSFLVSQLTLGLVGGGLLLVRMEGIICLLMAAPLAFVLSILGGGIAHAIVATVRASRKRYQSLSVVALFLPGSMVLEHQANLPAPLLKVVSAVEINAPPSVVWRHVVTFSELPPPTEWVFRTGVAFPIRATIDGSGPGAIRRCEFSTGPFIEPITVWDEPRLLQFRVTSNPEPLQEWTPYREIHPPHLDGYLASRQGQFQLTALPGNRTRLEGTTWYQHHLWPVGYWQLWSDFIIHTIHNRVLHHIQQLSEASSR